MNSKFKVGDKVRYVGNDGPWVEYQVTNALEGVVVSDDYYDGEICVSFGGSADIPADDLELIEPYDKKQKINIGDKVRVSKDAPKMYVRGWDLVVKFRDCTVERVEDDNAVISYGNADLPNRGSSLAIPTKYLVKVEDEKKEYMFKIGDKVRVKPDAKRYHDGSNCTKHYCWLPERDQYLGKVGTVTHVALDGDVILDISGKMYWNPIDIEPYEKLTKDDLEEAAKEWSENMSAAIEEYGEAVCETYNNAVAEAYWDGYTAELAKEVAVKIVSENMDKHHNKVGVYAANVAKSVVENLKKK